MTEFEKEALALLREIREAVSKTPPVTYVPSPQPTYIPYPGYVPFSPPWYGGAGQTTWTAPPSTTSWI